MPNYEEILQQSGQNVIELKQSLLDLEKLRTSLQERILQTNEIPKLYDDFYNKIQNQTTEFVAALGISTKSYVDGNNRLFVQNLERLNAAESKINQEVQRLSEIDFEKHFVTHQKTLSDLFQVISTLNVNITNITQSIGLLSTLSNDTNLDIKNNHIDNLNEFNSQNSQIDSLHQNTKLNTKQLVDKINKVEKENRLNRIIIIIGFILIAILLIILLTR